MIRYVLAILALSMTMSCSAAQQGKAAEVTKAVYDCGVEVVQGKLPEVFPIVTAIIGGETVDWRGLLAELARSTGNDVVACALNAIALPTATALARAPEGPARSRAAQYLREREWEVLP